MIFEKQNYKTLTVYTEGMNFIIYRLCEVILNSEEKLLTRKAKNQILLIFSEVYFLYFSTDYAEKTCYGSGRPRFLTVFRPISRLG